MILPLEESSIEPTPRPGAQEPGGRKTILLSGIVGLAGALLLFLELRHGVPRANDLADHAGTAVQVLSAFRDGVFYPRWMPDFHAGLGEPTLNFYPPGLYLVSALLAWLLGGDVLAGLFTMLFLLAVAGGMGMFVFLRRPLGTG
ncbi:MAG TPA: hypothetical protein VKJ00_08535, partial [Thermoanaerobaculia bacterium]|nr:hypothetical protein [Thermoanaerobaculia bacterium]